MPGARHGKGYDMSRWRTDTLAVVCLIVAASGVSAPAAGLAVTGRSGTLGLGGDLVGNILIDLNARFGASFFNLDFDTDFGDVNYDLDLDLLTFPISVDWYVFDDAFHLTAGIILNETDIRLDAKSAQSFTIGDTVYTPADIGTLRGEAEFNRIAPYIGIGWGNAFGRQRRWGFMTDMGVAFIGSPEISLSATGPIAGDPLFADDIEEEEQKIEDDLSAFRFYPVLSLSLFFRF
jgi:hypothetical protein